MSNQEDSVDKKLDALLHGGLSETDARALRKELEDADRSRNGLEPPGIEKAPETLRRKLREIPVRHKRNAPPLVYGGALATVVLSVIVGLLIYNSHVPDEPTPEEIEQARKDLITAFNYLEDIGQRTSTYMTREIGDTMEQALLKGIVHGVSDEPENG